MPNDIDVQMTPEEERLWRMDDEELEKVAFEEKHGGASENEEDNNEEESEVEDTEQSDEPEDETEEEPDEEDDSENESEDDEDSNTADDTEEEEDSKKEQPTNTEKSESENTESLKPVRADGMDIPVKSLDEVYQMASMGYNYKKKMADIAPYRRAVSAMKEHGLTDTDIALLVDIKKGDKAAIAQVMKDGKVDPLEFDADEHEYQSKVYGEDDTIAAIKEIESQISADPEYKTTVNVVNKLWDKESQRALRERPELIKGLHEDIKQGIYEKIAPEAARLEFLDSGNKSKLEYYIQAAQLMAKQESEKQKILKDKQVKQEVKVSQKRKAAATTKSKATREARKETDWVNMSDADYDKFYKEVMMS